MKLTISEKHGNRRIVNILLVAAYQSVSLAAAYFYEILKRELNDIEEVNLYIRTYERFSGEVDYSFTKDILLLRPDFAAFSNFFWNYDSNLRMAETYKSLLKDGVTVFGGPQTGDIMHASKILERNSFIDFILCGEADFTFPRLVRSIILNDTVNDIPGLVSLNIGSKSQDGREIFVKDLSELPLVYHAESEYLLSGLNRGQPLPMETLRGCRSNCSYCYYCTKTLRFKPIKTVENEISFLCNAGAKYVRVCDSHFGGSQARAMELLDLMKFYNKNDTSFYIYPDPTHIDREYINAAKEANCRIISIGIETLDPKVISAVDRNISPDDSKKALKTLKSHDITPQVDLIFGLPGQTLESFKNDIIFLKSNGYDNILFSPLMLFPGTRLAADSSVDNITVLPVPQNFGYSNTFGSDGYAEAYKIIDIFELLKIISGSEIYIFKRYFKGEEYEKMVRLLFSAEALDNWSTIVYVKELLTKSPEIILKKQDHIINAIKAFFADILDKHLEKDSLIDEIIRYDLSRRAMSLRAAEIRKDIYPTPEIREIGDESELREKRLKLGDYIYLDKFEFSQGSIAKEDSIDISSKETTYCVFDCLLEKSYFITADEYRFLNKFRDPVDGSSISTIKNSARQIKKWLKKGVLTASE